MAFDPPWFKTQDAHGKMSYDTLAPLVLTLLPAGHPPGKYMCAVSVFVITASASGTMLAVLGWNMPVAGAASGTIFGLGTSSPGLGAGSTRLFESSGLAAVTLTLSGSAVVGDTAVRVNANALFMGPLVTTP